MLHLLRIPRLPGWLVFLSLFSSWARAQTAPFTAGNLTYSQDFNALPTTTAATNWTNGATLNGWYAKRSKLGDVTQITAGTGSSNSGALYSFASTTATTDRALGSLASGTPGNFGYGVVFQNNTGQTITALTVGYTGEQWRVANANNPADKLEFSYKISASAVTDFDATSATSGGFTAFSALDFSSPQNNATAAALDGNANANRQTFSNVALTVNVPPGQYIALRWFDVDNSGADNALAVDDLTVTATTTNATDPALTSAPNAVSLTYPQGSGPASGSYTLSGTNLTPNGTITVTSGDAAKVKISVDGSPFDGTAAFTYAGTSFSGKTISLQLTSGLPVGTYPVTLTNAGGGAVSISTSVNGSVTSANGCPSSGTMSIRCARELALSAGVGNVNTSASATVEGVVTASNFGGTTLYLQDATGGIALFKSTGELDLAYPVGRQIRVSGKLTYFFGTAEFSNPTIADLGAGTLPAPVALTPAQMSDPANFGKLVTVSGAAIDDPRLVFSAKQTYPFTTPGTGLRVEPNVQELVNSLLVKTPNPLTVTGILDPNDNDDDPTTSNSTFQVKPRGNADVTPVPVNFTPTGGTNLSKDQTLDVAELNLAWFGSTSLGPVNSGAGDATQVANVKKVLKALNADVYFLEEVVDPALLDQVKDYLSSADGLNAPFEKVCSPCVSNGGSETQKVCFLYKTKVSNAADAAKVVEKLSTECLLQGNAQAESDWASGRLPFLMSANVTIGGVTQNVKFIGAHAKAFDDVVSYNRRKSGSDALEALLSSSYATDNLIFGGDLNDDLDQSIVRDNGQYLPTPYSAFTTQLGKYNPLTLALSQQGFGSTIGFDNVIDHLITSNEIKPSDAGVAAVNYVSNSVGLVSPDQFTDIADYVNTTTDHLPPFARFTFTAATLNATEATLEQGQTVNRTIATVGNAGVLPAGASVTASAASNGVSLANLQLNTGTGAVTADVTTSCSATDASFTLTLTYGLNTATTTLNVGVTALPDLTVTPVASEVCAGTPVTLTAATCNGTLTWAPEGGTPSGNTYLVAPTGKTTYTATCTTNGCVKTADATITVNPNPTATASASPNPVCETATLTLSAQASGGTGVLSYAWSGPNGFSASTNPATRTATPADGGVYTVTVTDYNQCKATAQTTSVTVDERVRLQGITPSQAVCANVDFTLSAQATGSSLTYQWYRVLGGQIQPVAGGTGASLTVNLQLPTSYYVIVTGPCNQVTSSTVALALKPPTTLRVTSMVNTVCENANLTLSVSGNGPGSLQYAWRKDSPTGPVIATGSSFTIQNAQPSDAGTYYASVAGDCPGPTVSIPVTVRYVRVTTQPQSQQLCSGVATLSVAVQAVGLGLTATYQWKRNGQRIAGATQASYPVVRTGSYTVDVKTSCGTLTSDAAVISCGNGRLAVEVEAQPSLSIAPNPVSGQEIHCRVSGLTHPQFSLFNAMGRQLGVNAATPGASGQYQLRPTRKLEPGLYVLEAREGTIRLVQRLLVIE